MERHLLEALIFIFAEILFACMAPVFALCGLVFGALLELLAAVFGGIFTVGAEGRRGKPVKGKAARKPLIPRRVIHWGAGIMAGIGVLGVVASFVLFQPLLRYVMTTAAEKAGMRVTYDSAEGMLLAGDVTLRGIHLTRPDEMGLGFDLRVAMARADVDVWSLLRDLPVIELAQVEGVTGHVSPPEPDKAGKRPHKERRPFRVELMRAARVDVEVRPKTGPAYALVIPEAEVAPFGSRTALFDLLFRSNMQAEVAGQPLRVETRSITEFGRETFWLFEDIEAAKLQILVPRAPLTWLDSGTVTLQVEDRWSLSDDWIDMDWQFGFEELDVRVPPGVGATEKVLGGVFAKAVAATGGSGEFRYRLDLDREDIAAMRAGDLNRFWDVVLSGIVKGKTAKTEAPGAETEGGNRPEPGRARKALGKLKGLFGKDEGE